ncbi:hypothetical protein CHU98_g10034 [Xylaria longipes]|nr:hypothetical protein CHU98_g10034 [Xylaria longipes]
MRRGCDSRQIILIDETRPEPDQNQTTVRRRDAVRLYAETAPVYPLPEKRSHLTENSSLSTRDVGPPRLSLPGSGPSFSSLSYSRETGPLSHEQCKSLQCPNVVPGAA